MANYTYEDMETLIPNTTMRKLFIDGVHRTYNIQANEGYVLHDNNYDQPIIDEETYEQIGSTLGYHGGVVSCGYFYDFTPVEMLDEAGNTVTAYGSRKFFAKLASEVPSDQIFGVTEPDHEIM